MRGGHPTVRVKLAIATSCATLISVASITRTLDAHKPVTSKYTYNEDVYPVFKDRCGRCHVAGGVGPMSLLNYKDAYPWAESIRTELLAETMPPWHADEGLGAGRTLLDLLSPRELDVLLVWTTGGTPQGSAANAPPAAPLHNDWPLGKPDVELVMPEAFVLAADKQEATHQFIVETGLTRERSLRAIGVKPGNPALVRHVAIALAPAHGTSDLIRKERPQANRLAAVAEWTPGSGTGPLMVPQLKAAARLLVTIHYKRTWMYEGTALTDRTSVGLYFGTNRKGG